MASDPRDLTDNMEPVLPGSSTRLLRLLILGVLHRADEVSFKFIAVITRNIGSSGEGPCTLGEQVHALTWLIDRGLVRMKTRQHRACFWEAVQENLSFYATDRGNDLITRMHQEKWHDDAPGFAVLEEGGAELSPSAIRGKMSVADMKCKVAPRLLKNAFSYSPLAPSFLLRFSSLLGILNSAQKTQQGTCILC